MILMMGLPLKTWLLFLVWLIAGLALYFVLTEGGSQNPSHT